MNKIKPQQALAVLLACVAVLLLKQEISIFLLKQELQNTTHDQAIQLNILKSQYSTKISLLEAEIDELELENEFQAIQIEGQAVELQYYRQYSIDMAEALNEYRQALLEAVPYIQFPAEWDGPVLSKAKGCIMGPSGRETYYNLNMKNCIKKMRQLGYTQRAYPYWIREDGAKMLGPYVMIAANWSIRPLGSIVETSLGWGIVVDTGEFINTYPEGVDIATSW